MAKGPEFLTTKVKSEVDNYEAFIDSNIDANKYNYNAYKNVVVIYLISFPSKQAREILTRRYIDAGWKRVEFETDQRDGSRVELYK